MKIACRNLANKLIGARTKKLLLLIMVDILLILPFFGMAGLIYFSYIPGNLLLKRMISDNKLAIGLKLILSIITSLLLIMASGVLLNTLVFLGVEKPLSNINILATLNVLTIFAIYISRDEAILRTKKSIYELLFNSDSQIKLLATILPIISILGAIVLNNNGSNIIAMTSYFAIFLLSMYLMIGKKRSENTYMYVIYTMALAILLSTSMRGWGIVGHDIQIENYFFHQTLETGLWSVSGNNLYSTCVSITILPTILSVISGLDPNIVFKILLQIFAAIIAPIAYKIARNFSNKKPSFMAALLFISLPTFILDMPMLVRQEIAFLFFGAFVLIAINPTKIYKKITLLPILSLGVAMAHYSTAYIMALLLFVFIAFKYIVKFLTKKTAKKNHATITLPVIIISFILIASWSLIFLQSNYYIISKTVSSIQYSISVGLDNKSSDTNSLLFTKKVDAKEQFMELANENNLKDIEYIGMKYSDNAPLGQFLSENGINTNELNSIFRLFISGSYQIFILSGLVLILVNRRKGRDMAVLVVGSLALMLMFVLLPSISSSYGLFRFFQQIMIILVVPIAFTLSKLIKLNVYVLALFIGFAFLHTSGFIPQITGGYYAQLPLNNIGLYYDAYYTHRGEEYSALWLEQNIATNQHDRNVQSDNYAKTRLLNGILNGTHGVAPLINNDLNNAYEYYGYSNIYNNTFIENIDGTKFYYNDKTHPNPKNNLIYSNNDSAIYRRETNISR